MRQTRIGEYIRVSKQRALSVLKAGKSIYLCAHKMRPFTEWHIESEQTKDGLIAGYGSIEKGFEAAIASYIYYNCSSETGYYPAYYCKG